MYKRQHFSSHPYFLGDQSQEQQSSVGQKNGQVCLVLRKSVDALQNYRETYPKQTDREIEECQTVELKLRTRFAHTKLFFLFSFKTLDLNGINGNHAKKKKGNKRH